MNGIKEYIEMYKKFMLIDEFPDVVTEDYEEQNLLNAVAVVNNDDIINNRFILKCRNNMEEFHQNYIEAVIFHEFTHILDGLKFREFDYAIFLNLMTTYSEYHSSRIELMYLYGYKNIFDKKQIKIKKKIASEKDFDTVNDYVLQPLSRIVDKVSATKEKYDCLSEDEFIGTYIKFEKDIMFMLGYLSVIENNRQENKQLLSFCFDNCGFLKSDITQIYKVLKGKNDFFNMPELLLNPIFELRKKFSETFSGRYVI